MTLEIINNSEVEYSTKDAVQNPVFIPRVGEQIECCDGGFHVVKSVLYRFKINLVTVIVE